MLYTQTKDIEMVTWYGATDCYLLQRNRQKETDTEKKQYKSISWSLRRSLDPT